MAPPRLDCLARTERFELFNPETRGKRWGDWRLIFIAETSGLPRRMQRHCRRAEGPVGPVRDPAPPAMVPLRGLWSGVAMTVPASLAVRPLIERKLVDTTPSTFGRPFLVTLSRWRVLLVNRTSL